MEQHVLSVQTRYAKINPTIFILNILKLERGSACLQNGLLIV